MYETTAERFCLQNAMKYFADYKRAYFPEISKTLGFKELDVAEVVSYLSIPDLFLNGKEMTAFEAAITWLEHKPQQRYKNVHRVLCCINLLQIPMSDITEKVSKVKVIINNAECVALIREALAYHDEIFTQPFYDGKIVNTRGVTDGFVAFPQWTAVDEQEPSNGYTLTQEEVFGDLDPDMAFWRYLSVEGKGGSTCLDKLFVDLEGQDLPSFMEHFVQGKAKDVFLNESIPKDRKPPDFVTSKKPELFKNDAPIKIGNFLFLFTKGDPLSEPNRISALRYNPILDEWVSLEPPPLNPRNKTFSFAQCSDKHIMLVGGERVNLSRIKQGSAFYFIYSIADDEWEKGKKPFRLHSCPKALYHGGSLYVADGKRLISYDIIKGMWMHECLFQLTLPLITSYDLLGFEEKVLMALSSLPDTKNLGYNFENRNVKEFHSPFTNSSNFIVGSFSHGKCLYLMYGTDKLKVTWLFRISIKTEEQAMMRFIPCFCRRLHAVPMLLPRFQGSALQ